MAAIAERQHPFLVTKLEAHVQVGLDHGILAL
jgi:hypothetical protein